MKSKFFVFNKEKIYAYLVSIMTIVVIFFLSNMLSTDLNQTEDVFSNEINTLNNINPTHNLINITNTNV